MFGRILPAILLIVMLFSVPSFGAPKACFRELNPALDTALTTLETRLNLINAEMGLAPLLSFKIGDDPKPKILEEILKLPQPEKYRQYINIIEAAQKIFEQNLQIAKLSEEGNRVLQDPKRFTEFAQEFSEQLGLAEKNKTPFSILAEWAKSWGWRGAIEVHEGHDFLRDSIGKRHLFRDLEMQGTRHGADSHALQLAYLTWHFAKIYGVEQAMSFMEFLSAREGTVIWKILVDRQGLSANLRSPDVFSDTKILQAFGMD